MEEEARKVLEQTARMREAEAEKIRAAIAGIKGEIASKPEPEKVEEPVAPVVPEPVAPVEPEPNPFVTRRETIAPEPVQFANTVAIQRGDKEIEAAHQATRDRITKMAQAREDFFAGFEPEEKTPIQPPIEKPVVEPEPAPAPIPEERPMTGRNTMLSGDTDLTRTRAIDKAAILEGMEKTRRLEKAELNAQEDKAFFESLETPAEETVEDLLNQLDTTIDVPAEEPVVSAVEEAVEEPVQETFAEPVEEIVEEPVAEVVEEAV